MAFSVYPVSRQGLGITIAISIALAIVFPLEARAQITSKVNNAEKSRIENVILITLDGLRTQEVFGGAELALITKEFDVKDPEECKKRFWHESANERRRILLPFLWEQIDGEQGWIAGDVDSDSIVRVSNGMYFSYPGYSEILCGYGDPRINSNDKKYNDNITVFEWIKSQTHWKGRIAAYTSWDVFPFIINDKRSHIEVNSGWSTFTSGEDSDVTQLNLISETLYREWGGVRYDALTMSGALLDLESNHPRLLFVSLGETDDWAHMGKYDRYLASAQGNDRLIRELWNRTQSIPQYRDRTLFLITTDHGRGTIRDGWKSHGKNLPGSEFIWIAALGPRLNRTGVDSKHEFVQAQVAATVARAFDLDFQSHRSEIHPALPILD